MPIRKQISFINRQKSNDAHRQIKNVGGIHDGRTWIISEGVALAFMTLQMEEYYILDGTKEIDIVFGVFEGKKYLKTVNDLYLPELLLSLPEIPVMA